MHINVYKYLINTLRVFVDKLLLYINVHLLISVPYLISAMHGNGLFKNSAWNLVSSFALTKAISLSETSVNFYHTIQYHMPQDSFYKHGHEYLGYHSVILNCLNSKYHNLLHFQTLSNRHR